MGHSARTRPDLMVHYKFQISFMSGSIGCEQQVLIYSGKCLRPYSIWVDFEKFWGFNKGNAQICLSYTSSKKKLQTLFFPQRLVFRQEWRQNCYQLDQRVGQGAMLLCCCDVIPRKLAISLRTRNRVGTDFYLR